jgi:hypothetical protein
MPEGSDERYNWVRSGCPRSTWWSCVSVGEACRMAVPKWVVAAHLGERPGP